MPMKFLGKILFPRSASWQQRRSVKILLAVILTAIIFALIVGALIFYANTKR